MCCIADGEFIFNVDTGKQLYNEYYQDNLSANEISCRSPNSMCSDENSTLPYSWSGRGLGDSVTF